MKRALTTGITGQDGSYLGSEPEVDFVGLVRMMVEHDLELELARREKHALEYQTV